MKKTASEIIKDARMKLGLSQKDLADKAGLNKNTVYYIESNKCEPKVETYKKLCSVLNISISELIE